MALLLLAVPMVLSAMAIDAADARCLTRKAARATWPHEHLKWRHEGRHRCWYLPAKAMANKEVQEEAPKTRALLASASDMEEAKPIEQLEPFVGGVLGVLREAEENRMAFDEMWQDIKQPDDIPSGTVVFSTFLGEPPDVWPELPPDPTPWRIAFVTAIFGAMGWWTWRAMKR